MTSKEEIPEDLGLKVVSKDQAFWIKIEEKCDQFVKDMENELKLQKAILEMARKKIKRKI